MGNGVRPSLAIPGKRGGGSAGANPPLQVRATADKAALVQPLAFDSN
jgi:hypothetical protein